jgi:hypothetical protein
MRKLAQAAGLGRGALSNPCVQRAADGQAAAIEDVSVDHGRFDILVAQELLHCSDIIVGFQEVGHKTMAQLP